MGDRDRGGGAAVIVGLSERWIGERPRRDGFVVLFALIECVIPAVHLGEVMVLEVIVERLKELIDGSDGLVGHVGEEERIGVLGHLSEPRGGAGLGSPVEQTPAGTAFHRVR